MQEKKKLYIKTWGCQMNVYDSHRMADLMVPLGYEQVDAPDDADMIVLNTCHIREKATDKVFSELGRLREHKDRKEDKGDKCLMVLTGCVAQAKGKIITDRAPYVDIVLGSQSYYKLPEIVAAHTKKRIINTDFPTISKFDFLPEEHQGQGVSAFLAIQEGCDRFCSYCVVPYTRGGEYSRTVVEIMDEAKTLIDSGAQEITLLGQNVNAYHGQGPDGKHWTLAQLFEALAKMEDLKRIRYTTSYPSDVNDDLINAHRDIDKLMPYIHLPVQSGSDSILKAMNRKHTAQEYLQTIEKLRTARPDIAVSGDFIVGFPGETDQDFEDTIEVIKEVQYASAYSFKFSPRPGTPAASMENSVPESIKNERLQTLQAVLRAQQERFNKTMIGKTLPVLLDRKGRIAGQLHGRTPYNQAMHIQTDEENYGKIIYVMINDAHLNSLQGII